MSRGKKIPLNVAGRRNAGNTALPQTKQVDRSLVFELEDYIFVLTKRRYNLFKKSERQKAFAQFEKDIEFCDRYIIGFKEILWYYRGNLRGNKRIVENLTKELKAAQDKLALVDVNYKYPLMQVDINTRHVLKTFEQKIMHYQKIIKKVSAEVERIEQIVNKHQSIKDDLIAAKEQLEFLFKLKK